MNLQLCPFLTLRELCVFETLSREHAIITHSIWRNQYLESLKTSHYRIMTFKASSLKEEKLISFGRCPSCFLSAEMPHVKCDGLRYWHQLSIQLQPVLQDAVLATFQGVDWFPLVRVSPFYHDSSATLQSVLADAQSDCEVLYAISVLQDRMDIAMTVAGLCDYDVDCYLLLDWVWCTSLTVTDLLTRIHYLLNNRYLDQSLHTLVFIG